MSVAPLIRHQAWRSTNPPGKILAIRFQALGDVVITLPYLQNFKENYPDCEIHFLTRAEDCSIPRSISTFAKVIAIGGGRNTKLQFFSVLKKIPGLLFQGYDVVLDLQNHWISRFIRRVVRPPAWCEFDKHSLIPAGDRYRQAMMAIGLGRLEISTALKSNLSKVRMDALLMSAGWDGVSELIILNPAGFFSSRNWPLENFITFAKKWIDLKPGTQFLLVGTERMEDKARYILGQLGKAIVNLTGKTNAAEAFALVRRAQLILTEDSGLMHMAWVQGVPTLALFGSSQKDWSAPQGKWTLCLNSSDLECGQCMLEQCKFGDNRCLTRYSASNVLERARELLSGQTV